MEDFLRWMEEFLDWILMISLSPIAFLLFMLMALYSLLRFLYKVGLLFIIIAINTPFAVMYNLSVFMFHYYLARLLKSNPGLWNWFNRRAGNVGTEVDNPGLWNWSDRRAGNVGTEVNPGNRNPAGQRTKVDIEVKLVVSDFFKVLTGELLVLMATGIITYYTAPLKVFYISTAIAIVAVFHKWLNTNCPSKTAFSCFCDCYGLSPAMFLFSFIGFFDMGCHPVAKCSFVACQAFLFVRDRPNELNVEADGHNHQAATSASRSQSSSTTPTVTTKVVDNREYEIAHLKEGNVEEGTHSYKLNEEEDGRQKPIPISTRVGNFEAPIVLDVEQGGKELNEEDRLKPMPKIGNFQEAPMKVNVEQVGKELKAKVVWHQFDGSEINPEQQNIEFWRWNAFERGLFRLSPRIDFIHRGHGKYVLQSFMVLKLVLGKTINLQCEYPMERLELPGDYSKTNELYNFLVTLSVADGFVTDKMRGEYEHSLTLLEIVEGVKENARYKIVDPMGIMFVVAGCI